CAIKQTSPRDIPTWPSKSSHTRHVCKLNFKLSTKFAFEKVEKRSHNFSFSRSTNCLLLFSSLEIQNSESSMGLRIVYGVVFLSFSCACFKLLHLFLHPVFYLTS
ncbi:hypothetical protein OWV82_022213, partial [Melia azedarach]